EEVPVLQQGHVVLPVALDVAVAGDELVQVVEALVVTGVGHGAAVLGDDHVRALVLETAQRGVLARGGAGIEGIDLDDVAEAVRLVLAALVPGVETIVLRLPAAGGGSVGEAVALVRLGGAGGAEVPVEVLLAGEQRPPRGEAAGAVAEGAKHDGAGRVL